MVLIYTLDPETHDGGNLTVGFRICLHQGQKTITNNPSPTILASAFRILPATGKASVGIEIDLKWSHFLLPGSIDVLANLCISRRTGTVPERTGTVPEKYNANNQHDSDYNNELFHGVQGCLTC